jgi:hypothetical protein
MQAHLSSTGRLARTLCALTLGAILTLGYASGTPQTMQAGILSSCEDGPKPTPPVLQEGSSARLPLKSRVFKPRSMVRGTTAPFLRPTLMA